LFISEERHEEKIHPAAKKLLALACHEFVENKLKVMNRTSSLSGTGALTNKVGPEF